MKSALIVSLIGNVVTLVGLVVTIMLARKNREMEFNKILSNRHADLLKTEFDEATEFISTAENLRFTIERLITLLENGTRTFPIDILGKLARNYINQIQELHSNVFQKWFTSIRSKSPNTPELIFMSGFLHDGCNVMAGVQGYLEIISSQLSEGKSPDRQSLETLRNYGDKACAMLRQISSLAVKESIAVRDQLAGPKNSNQ